MKMQMMIFKFSEHIEFGYKIMFKNCLDHLLTIGARVEQVALNDLLILQ